MSKCALCIVLCVFVLLTSCQEGNTQMNINMSPENENLVDLATVIYDSEELKNILSFTGSVEELNKDYPIYCIRKISLGYRVTYLGENGDIAILTFDETGNECDSRRSYSPSKSKDAFSNIISGMHVTEVREFDPDGVYAFLYSGRNDITYQSFHYTNDGFLVVVLYNENYIVSGVNIELI